MTAAVLLRAAVLSAAAALLVSKVAGQLQIEELGPEIRSGKNCIVYTNLLGMYPKFLTSMKKNL